ncbi:MAG TPA: hypothetical protein VMS02_05195 [Solirubrobacteraceae bacterium]|nr:hypothetical protein [Solirubrobacteraceae bacterium]
MSAGAQPTTAGAVAGARPASARASRLGGAGEALLVLLTGLAAAIPVIASCVNAIRAGWVPLADRGIIATRAHDVFTGHAPLVGQYTLAGEVTGHVTHSLGPMLFWLISIPAYYDSTVGMTLVMGAVNTGCVIGCVALAHRRGGRALMAMTALAIALMCQSLAAETFHDIWNPSAGLFPFTLLIFLCWSLACGAYRLLPLTVLVASFVMQAHLTYVPPTLALLAVGLGGLALRWLGRRRRGVPRLARRRVLAWGLATALVAGVCWSATIAGQLSEHPGNLTLVAETATRHKPTLGAQAGWNAVVRAVGLPPWWLQTPKSRWQRKYEVRSQPGAAARRSCIALLAALALVFCAAALRRRRELAALALCALVLCPALAAVAAATPTPRLLSATLGYTMWWGSQAGMMVWLALVWALWLMLVWALRRAGRAALGRTGAGGAALGRRGAGGATRGRTGAARSALGRAGAARGRVTAIASTALSLLALGATVAVASTVAGQAQSDEHVAIYRPVKALDARLAQLIPRGGSVLLEGELDGATEPVKPSLRYFLVTRGNRVLAPGSALRLGTWYELYRRRYREAVYLSDAPQAPAKHVRLLAQASFREGGRANTVYVWLSRRPGR